MVLFKIALVGAVVAASLFLLKQQHVFQRAGIIGSCVVVAAPAGESSEGQWWSCREGVITGFPIADPRLVLPALRHLRPRALELPGTARACAGLLSSHPPQRQDR